MGKKFLQQLMCKIFTPSFKSIYSFWFSWVRLYNLCPPGNVQFIQFFLVPGPDSRNGSGGQVLLGTVKATLTSQRSIESRVTLWWLLRLFFVLTFSVNAGF